MFVVQVGGAEQFEPFLRSYFDKFKYKSISTVDFKEHPLYDHSFKFIIVVQINSMRI